MKKQFLKLNLIAFAICLLKSVPAEATVWRVNNNGTTYVQYSGQQVFSDLAYAIATVSSGDTLHIEASPTTYNSSPIHITKKLVIIGPGYSFGGVTGNSNLQANHNEAKIGPLFFDAGAEYSVYTGITQVGQLHIRANNISVKRNKFLDDFLIDLANGTISNLLFTQNYFADQEFLQPYSCTVISSVISNNIFKVGSFYLQGPFQGNITQNVFDFNGNVDFSGGQFYNNIIKSGSLVANSNDTNNVHHNVFYFAAPVFLPTPNSNTFSFPAGNMFQTGGSVDGNFHINPLCLPCLNNGAFGYEIGIYGGAAGTEYKLSGVPEIPAIYQLYATPNIAQGDTIQVILKTRSNN